MPSDMVTCAMALAAAVFLGTWRHASATITWKAVRGISPTHYGPESVENDTYNAMIRCQDELKLDDDTFKELVLKIPKEDNEISRCFLECTMKNLGLVSFGEVDADRLTKHFKGSVAISEDFERHLARNIMECNLKYTGGNCMKTYKIWKCIVEYL